MALTTENMHPISVREGKIFIDGVEVYDCVAYTVKSTPDVWTGRGLSEKSPSSRWLGVSHTGTITRRRATPFLDDMLKKYENTGRTPEFTIQGVANDKGSDYYQKHGTRTHTATGCVFTGDITRISLDAAGQVLDDVLTFNAKNVI
ncbi:MAG: phage tail tube protein [Oscillospiraceae bacterium]|jgi:hypothetical protein|nr:phage tail tube protein [Oscillospiraceae bacterium]